MSDGPGRTYQTTTVALFDPKLDLWRVREVSESREEYSPENDPNTIPRSGKSQQGLRIDSSENHSRWDSLPHLKPTRNKCVVLNDNVSGLRNLQPAALLVFCITKTVAADDRVVVNHDTLTEERAFANRDARVDSYPGALVAMRAPAC